MCPSARLEPLECGPSTGGGTGPPTMAGGTRLKASPREFKAIFHGIFDGSFLGFSWFLEGIDQTRYDFDEFQGEFDNTGTGMGEHLKHGDPQFLSRVKRSTLSGILILMHTYMVIELLYGDITEIQ